MLKNAAATTTYTMLITGGIICLCCLYSAAGATDNKIIPPAAATGPQLVTPKLSSAATAAQTTEAPKPSEPNPASPQVVGGAILPLPTISTPKPPPAALVTSEDLLDLGAADLSRYKELLTLDPNLQVIVNASQTPRSDRSKVLEVFYKFFTKPRSHDDQKQKELVRDGVILRLHELGFQTSFVQKSRFEFRRRPAYSYNMISIMPGRYRQTKQDRIVLIGAHWDSATQAPGVDDNGSGSTCLLEIARLIAEHKCEFNHTVMLVWFDYEEQGKYGSEFFVNEYLFPLELEKYQSKFIGAYILDMILVRDKENNTQMFPVQLKNKLPDLHEELEREKFRGDFLATWSRRTWDEPIEEAFRSSWVDLGFESRTFKAMRPLLPQTRIPNADERYEWKEFFRSDHASFWFPQLTSNAVRRSPNRTSSQNHTSLNAILLTDLGPWRKSYHKCYHAACDDEHLLTDGNLSFMQQVIDTLVLTLLRVGQGECRGPPSAMGDGHAASASGQTSAT